MAKVVETLRINPTPVPANSKVRLGSLYPTRFLRGAVYGSEKLLRPASNVTSLNDMVPLANYNLATVDLRYGRTKRRWVKIHNPALFSILLKLFSTTNMG
jgi:hypothetical protein